MDLTILISQEVAFLVRIDLHKMEQCITWMLGVAQHQLKYLTVVVGLDLMVKVAIEDRE